MNAYEPLAPLPALQPVQASALSDFFLKPSGPSAVPGCAWWDVACNVKGTIANAQTQTSNLGAATARDAVLLVLGLMIFGAGLWRLSGGKS